MLGEAQHAGEAITPAAEWLLDNAYLIDEANRGNPPRTCLTASTGNCR